MGPAALIALLSFQLSAIPKVGELAPPLALAELLQAPVGARATWPALRGKVVVLEFWATWCAGCVERIPHLNALADKFKGRPVQFLWVTDEERPLVSSFLRATRISGWVGLDPDGRTFAAYGIDGRPQTVLVDADGILRGVISPDDLTEAVLEDLIAGKPLRLPQRSSAAGSPSIGAEPGAPPPVLELFLRPAAPVALTGMSPGAARLHKGRYEFWGVTLRRLISEAYGVPESRIEAPGWNDAAKYDLALRVPKYSESERLPLLQKMLETVFRLKLRRELRERDVYLLRKIPGREPNLRPSAAQESGTRSPAGEPKVFWRTLAGLVELAQRVLGQPVFDETGLEGRYGFQLRWDEKNPASFLAAVREQLQLDLAPARRQLEFLVVESAQRPLTW